jgi:hypothetical protein
MSKLLLKNVTILLSEKKLTMKSDSSLIKQAFEKIRSKISESTYKNHAIAMDVTQMSHDFSIIFSNSKLSIPKYAIHKIFD